MSVMKPLTQPKSIVWKIFLCQGAAEDLKSSYYGQFKIV